MSTSTCTRCGVRFMAEANESLCPFCTADSAPETSFGQDIARGFAYGAAAMVLTGLVWYWLTVTMDELMLSLLFAVMIGLLIPTAIAYGSLRKPGLVTQGIALVQIVLTLIYSQYYTIRSMAGMRGSGLPALPGPVRTAAFLFRLLEENPLPGLFWLGALVMWIAFPLLVKHDKSGYLGVLARRLR